MKPNVLIMSGYGINCEKESAHAFERAGAKCDIVHINDLISKKKFLNDYDILMFPGGFSYGDDTGSGNAFANKIKNNLWSDLLEFINSKKLILGVCNGFQIMTHLGLFSLGTTYGERTHSMEANSSNRYICKWVYLETEKSNCVWTKGVDVIHVPIAHGEGRFDCSESIILELKNNNQIVFRYCNKNGETEDNFSINPNGSKFNIAGICDKSGRIMGMMPHPERGLYSISEPDFHLKQELAKRNGSETSEIVGGNFKIFQNAINYFKNSGEEGMSYKDAGVNIETGDEASKILYNAAKKTWANRERNIGELIVPFDDFSGVRGINVSNLPPGSFMSMGFDGVGTKVEIAQRMKNHKTIAFDLFAMVCDDAIVRGAEPVLIGSVLDVNSLGDGRENIEVLKELAEGYVKAAEDANVSVINGEIAELGNSVGGYGEFKYNWSSALIWFSNKEKLFTGKEINEGDYIVAFKEEGFRSNGLSLARKILETNYGSEWHNLKLDNEKLGSLVLTPSKIYSKAVVGMHGGFQTEGTCKINGISHITGGGIPGKLGRVLKPSGFGAVLDNLFEPCKIMKHCQKLGNVSDKESYKTWNMGQGLLVITPEPIKLMEEAKKFGIESRVCGKVVKEAGIKIISCGVDNGKELIF